MHRTNTCLEYVWIDGHNELRSKIKIISSSDEIKQDDDCKNTLSHNGVEIEVPMWNFDGSSTHQSFNNESDVGLKPVRLYKNPFFNPRPWDLADAYLVLCECYEKDGVTPHASNTRAECSEASVKYAEHECMFGIEQEYVLFNNLSILSNATTSPLPYKWTSKEDPGCGEQGPYYCSVGGDRSLGRLISDHHLVYCLRAGIKICGTNAEVMASQWEFQIGTSDALRVCDDLIMARYILHRITEEHNCTASLHPKPHTTSWNGSGAHTNFSTKTMRDSGGLEHIVDACEKLRATHSSHIAVYGEHNEERLTGTHETSSYDKYSWCAGDRGCSVRIPLQVVQNKRGYLEDRRPASNCDPYIVTSALMHSICCAE